MNVGIWLYEELAAFSSVCGETKLKQTGTRNNQISNKQAQDIANTQRQFKVNHLKKMKLIKEYANEQRSVKNGMIKSFSNITPRPIFLLSFHNLIL